MKNKHALIILLVLSLLSIVGYNAYSESLKNPFMDFKYWKKCATFELTLYDEGGNATTYSGTVCISITFSRVAEAPVNLLSTIDASSFKPVNGIKTNSNIRVGESRIEFEFDDGMVTYKLSAGEYNLTNEWTIEADLTKVE